VIAVTVVLEDGEAGERRAQQMEQRWARWDPGVPLRILHAAYASLAQPIVAFVDGLRVHHNKQIVVLILGRRHHCPDPDAAAPGGRPRPLER